MSSSTAAMTARAPIASTSVVYETKSPAERAVGAHATNAAYWHGAAVVVACAEPLVDHAGAQYTPTLDELAQDLKHRIEQIRAGDLSDPEAMLLAQAHALQALFSNLTLKALECTSLPNMQFCLSLALKAQAQCRATLTALADLKRPRQASFIGQQNVALNQQINNLPDQGMPKVILENPSNELLEAGDGERVDG